MRGMTAQRRYRGGSALRCGGRSSRTAWCAALAGRMLLAVCTLALVMPARATTAQELKAVATIKPVHALLTMVLDGIATPALLIDGPASPHSYALRPSDARALQDADVVVRVAVSVEPFTERIAETLPAGAVLVTLAEAPGIKLLQTRTGTAFEAHGHDHPQGGDDHVHRKDAQAHGHDHAHDHAHEAGGLDGHIWLDPENARAIVRHLASVFAERRPELKERLTANAEKAGAAIAALDAELRAVLVPLADKRFIVFHDAYQYLEAHYGLQAAGAITLNPEVKPSARRLSEIRETLAKTGARCVFAEPQFSPRIIATVIEGTAARSGTLDPLGSAIPAGSDHYAAMMRALAAAMRNCLGG